MLAPVTLVVPARPRWRSRWDRTARATWATRHGLVCVSVTWPESPAAFLITDGGAGTLIVLTGCRG